MWIPYNKTAAYYETNNSNISPLDRENILVGDRWWWLSTPNSTPSGTGSSYVQCVRDDGGVGWVECDRYGVVRPFFILKS